MIIKTFAPDAAHNRQLPTGRELAVLTRQIQARYWQEVQAWLPHASHREPPDPLRARAMHAPCTPCAMLSEPNEWAQPRAAPHTAQTS